MPILAAHFGPSGSSFLFESEESKIKSSKSEKPLVALSDTIISPTISSKRSRVDASVSGLSIAHNVVTANTPKRLALSKSKKVITKKGSSRSKTSVPGPIALNSQVNDTFLAVTASSGTTFTDIISSEGLAESPTVANIKFYYSPYVHNPVLFSQYVSEESFYSQIMQAFLQEIKPKSKKFDVYTTNYGSTPYVKSKKFVSFEKIITQVSDYYPVYVGSSATFTRDATSQYDLSRTYESRHPSLKLDDSNYNFFSNLSVYSQLRHSDIGVILEEDQMIISSALREHKGGALPLDGKVLFTGGRFFRSTKEMYHLDYVMMLDFIQSSGFHEVFLDRNDAYVLFSLLGDDATNLYLSDYVERLGTVLRFEGAFECSVESELGTKQIFDVPENSIYIVPLDVDTVSKVVMKNLRSGDVVEKFVSGGSLGIIFNTLPLGNFINSDRRILNNALKQFSEASVRI